MLRVPRNILMPIILMFCIVGAFAINNSLFGVGLILFFGVLAFVLEENGFPTAPAILGVVLGTMLEENFITSMIKSRRRPVAYSSRARSPAGWRSSTLRHPLLAGRRAGWCAKRAGRQCGRRDRDCYSIALTMSSTTFFASPNTIIVLSM